MNSVYMDLDILNEVQIEPLEDGDEAFYRSLSTVLARIAPLTAAAPGRDAEERVRYLAAAINITLDELDALCGVVDPHRLPSLIDRVAELAVTGNNVEVQIGVAGDLRMDKHHRLVVDEVLTSCRRIPPTIRPTALREGITTLQRLLALLLLHGWTDGMTTYERTRQEARRAIVDTVQGVVVSS